MPGSFLSKMNAEMITKHSFALIELFFLFLCLAFLGLHYYMGIFLVLVSGLLVAMASLVPEHRLQACGLQSLQHMGSVVRAAEI